MNQNLCALLVNVDSARRFVGAVADGANFKRDAQNMCDNAVVDPGKRIRDTLPSGARFRDAARPNAEQTLRQVALFGDHNKVLLMVIGLLFSSSDLRDIVTKNTPRIVASEYFSDFHSRIENAKVGTTEEARFHLSADSAARLTFRRAFFQTP